MRDVLNGQEMKQCDENTMKMGMLSAVLMERAALSVVKKLWSVIRMMIREF